MYVDESGDSGLNNSPTDYFCLSGLVVHECAWHGALDRIIEFRREIRDRYGLKLKNEIHAAEFIHSPGELSRIKKSLRLNILRDCIDFQSMNADFNVVNVVVDKRNKPKDVDVFELAWKTLIQRFHNTVAKGNFPGSKNDNDLGILIVDETDEPRLRKLGRKMRRFNHVPNAFGGGSRSITIDSIVEDAVHRNSAHSYFIQLSDVNAYFLAQKYKPCSYVKRKGARNYFDRLDPVLCKVASRTHKYGVVER